MKLQSGNVEAEWSWQSVAIRTARVNGVTLSVDSVNIYRFSGAFDRARRTYFVGSSPRSRELEMRHNEVPSCRHTVPAHLIREFGN